MFRRLQHQGLGAMFLPLILAVLLVVNVLGATIPSSGQAWAHYLAYLYRQIDGSAFANANCVLANATTAMDTASLGYWRVPASRLRVLSGDTSGGVDFDTMIATVKSATSGEVKFTRLYFMPTADLDALLEAPRVVGLSIDCSVTIDTPFHTASYTGRHNVLLVDKRTYTWTDSAGVRHSQKQYLVGDPGRHVGEVPADDDYRWWPASLVVKAAVASSGAAGECHVWYSADLEGVTRTARSTLTVWSKPVDGTADSTSKALGTISSGGSVSVRQTRRGAAWTVNSHPGAGWAQVPHGTGVGYVKGGRLKAA